MKIRVTEVTIIKVIKIAGIRTTTVAETIADTMADIEDEVVIRAVVTTTQIVEITRCVVDRTDCHRMDRIPVSFVGELPT